MLETKTLPKSFCRDFIEIRGHPSQIVMYMSLVLGFKPLMDDWIPRKRLSEFRKICNKYGVHLKEDIIFGVINKQDIKGEVLGKDMITTTSSYGFPLRTDIEGGVHVFLSRDKKILNKGMWYPVIVRGRLISSPRADILNYGYSLGYPDCCIKFFRKYNNWNKYSFLYEIYKNSDNTKQCAFYCNPFLKDAVYCYIYHMPCSFQCKKTIKLVASLRKEIKKKEPQFVETIDQYLKMPLLVFYERKFYAFDGKLTQKNEISYSKGYFTDVDNNKNLYQEILSRGNRIKLNGRDVAVYQDKNLIETICVPLEKFAPEYPYIIQFS